MGTKGTLTLGESKIVGTLNGRGGGWIDFNPEGASSTNGFYDDDGWVFEPTIEPVPLGTVAYLNGNPCYIRGLNGWLGAGSGILSLRDDTYFREDNSKRDPHHYSFDPEVKF